MVADAVELGRPTHPPHPGLAAGVRAERLRCRTPSRGVEVARAAGAARRRADGTTPVAAARARGGRAGRPLGARPARPCSSCARATGKAGEVTRPGAAAAARRTPPCAGCCWSVSASSARRLPAGRGGAGPRRPRPGRAWRPRSPRCRRTTGLEAFVVGAMLGSFALPLALRRRPSTSPVAPDRAGRSARPRRRRRDAATAPSRLGGAGWRARMLATVPSNLKNPAWLAEQARALGGRARPRRHGLGRAAARRARASAASSASAGPRRRRPG